MVSFLPIMGPPVTPPGTFPGMPMGVSVLSCAPGYSTAPYPMKPAAPTRYSSSAVAETLCFSTDSRVLSVKTAFPSVRGAPSITVVQ